MTPNERAKRTAKIIHDHYCKDNLRKLTETAIELAIEDAIKEKGKEDAAHADSVARTSALLPLGDPYRDGPRCARQIEKLILG